MFNFPLTKSSQQRKTARHCKTRMESNIVSIGSYVWLFLLDFPQTEIAWCSSTLLRSATVEQFLVSFTGKNVSRVGLLHMINPRVLRKYFAVVQKLSSCCLPSAYRAHVSNWWTARQIFYVAREA